MSGNESTHPIFIVDDEKALANSLGLTLRSFGLENIKTFYNGQEVLQQLSRLECRVMLLDLFMPGISGEDILQQVKDRWPHVQVVIITALNETDSAVRCMKSGAFDYLVKPVEADRLVTTVRLAMNHAVLLRQNLRLKQKLLTGGLDHPEHFRDIITQDPKMKGIFSYLEVVAPASNPLLITGETGTGKDLAARASHLASGRKGRFISLDAAGLDDNVFADTLFGHVKGAFTDAREARKGLIEQAEGGTLFLDEIGDLSPASQIKLLKLTQDRVYYPLGSDTPRASRARIIAATNRDLESRQKDGLFRSDLFYRINTYHVHLPPLRERGADILLLAENFLEKACADLGVAKKPLCPRVSRILMSYNYPGNIRELQSLVYAAVAGGGMDLLEKKIEELQGEDSSGRRLIDSTNLMPPAPWSYPEPLPTLEQAVDMLITQAMLRAQGNQARAARMLGISRQALNKRIRKA